ncbi:MAG TPA: undecaprenyl-diphosphate phosphatase [bacterium]|nr:undecaprenyl-diphosphate phosphatase [bacterium]
MNVAYAAVLGLVQGLTEFLPVSSSGHLALFQNFLGLSEPMLFFDVMLHVGTLLAVFVYFRSEITGVALAAAGRAPGAPGAWPASVADGRKIILWILIASVPAGAVGLALGDAVESAFTSVVVVGGLLLITGTLLLSADAKTQRNPADGAPAAMMGLAGALIIGSAQAFALLPGVSRSGATICAAIFIGVARRDAARFSFLMAIPAIAGAAVLHLKDAAGTGLPPMLPVLAGAAVAFISGLIALKWLIAVLTRGRLLWFSIYCFAIGAAAIVLSQVLPAR